MLTLLNEIDIPTKKNNAPGQLGFIKFSS